MAEQKSGGNGSDQPGVIFDYIKSPQFRSIKGDGVIGAVTPSGSIHFAIYVERQSIPRQIVYLLKEDGSLGEEALDKRVGRLGFVREMDVDVFMSVDVAESFRNWLDEKIAEAKKRFGGQ